MGSNQGINWYQNNLKGQIEYVSKIKQASSLIMSNPILVEDDSLYKSWSTVSRDADFALDVLLGTPADRQTMLAMDSIRWKEFSRYFDKVLIANVYANQYSQYMLDSLAPVIKRMDSLILSVDSLR